MITLLQGLLTVGLSVVVAIALQRVVHRFVPFQVRKVHNDVAGFIYAVLGVAYAIPLAFLLVIVWQQYETARIASERGANELTRIYELASQVPEPQSGQIRSLARSYAEVVLTEEWPLLANGKESPHAKELIYQINRSVEQITPQTVHDQVVLEQLLARLDELNDERQERILSSRSGLHPGLWIVLVGGAIITIGFTYLFGLENTAAHSLMIGALTALIISLLFLIKAIDLPFTGDFSVRPDAYELVLEEIESG